LLTVTNLFYLFLSIIPRRIDLTDFHLPRIRRAIERRVELTPMSRFDADATVACRTATGASPTRRSSQAKVAAPSGARIERALAEAREPTLRRAEVAASQAELRTPRSPLIALARAPGPDRLSGCCLAKRASGPEGEEVIACSAARRQRRQRWSGAGSAGSLAAARRRSIARDGRGLAPPGERNPARIGSDAAASRGSGGERLQESLKQLESRSGSPATGRRASEKDLEEEGEERASAALKDAHVEAA
jgi:hypothetical protein